MIFSMDLRLLLMSAASGGLSAKQANLWFRLIMKTLIIVAKGFIASNTGHQKCYSVAL